jgi:hypothetical protein
MNMNKIKTRFPVSSFSSSLQAVLRKGAEEEVRLNFQNENLAIRFMHRINSLRSAMRKEGHKDWEQYYRAGVYRDRKDATVVIIAPRDHEFREAIDKAGVQTTPELRGFDPPQEVAEVSKNAIEDFLSEIRGKK